MMTISISIECAFILLIDILYFSIWIYSSAKEIGKPQTKEEGAVFTWTIVPLTIAFCLSSFLLGIYTVLLWHIKILW